jgi:hypothetical protein
LNRRLPTVTVKAQVPFLFNFSFDFACGILPNLGARRRIYCRRLIANSRGVMFIAGAVPMAAVLLKLNPLKKKSLSPS